MVRSRRRFARNRAIGENDHAEMLWHLLELRPDASSSCTGRRCGSVGFLKENAAPAAAAAAVARALAVEHRAALRPGRARCAARSAAPPRPPARERPLLLDPGAALAPGGRRARRRAAPHRARAARLCRGVQAERAPGSPLCRHLERRAALHVRRGRDARRRLHPGRPACAAHAQCLEKRQNDKAKPRAIRPGRQGRRGHARRDRQGAHRPAEVIDSVLCALLAGGHVLVEGVPAWARRCSSRRSRAPSPAASAASSSPRT